LPQKKKEREKEIDEGGKERGEKGEEENAKE
jgi:hypothetical protein